MPGTRGTGIPPKLSAFGKINLKRVKFRGGDAMDEAVYRVSLRQDAIMGGESSA